MLGIIVKLDISVRLTLQESTSICHHIKKILLKKYKQIWGLDKNPYIKKHKKSNI